MEHVQALLDALIYDLHVLDDLWLDKLGLLGVGFLNVSEMIQRMKTILLFHANVVFQVFKYSNRLQNNTEQHCLKSVTGY